MDLQRIYAVEETKNVEHIKNFLEQIDRDDERMRAATIMLFDFALENNIEIIEMLLESGAFINALNTIGRTPLHYASAYGNEKVVEFLLSRGARVNTCDVYGNTPLKCASKYNSTEHKRIAKLLKANGAFCVGFDPH